jgi:hypothetical protein
MWHHGGTMPKKWCIQVYVADNTLSRGRTLHVAFLLESSRYFYILFSTRRWAWRWLKLGESAQLSTLK